MPVYLWVVFGLGLGAAPLGLPDLSALEKRQALTLAILVVLGLTYIHRHYTFLLIYGDKATFQDRARDYVVAPLVIFGLAAALLSIEEPFEIGGARVPAFAALLLVSGLWNVWHTVQQRYGILRAYAGKAGGGLQTRSQARRDRALLWTLVGMLAVVLPVARPTTFSDHPASARVLRFLTPVIEHAAYRAIVIATLVFTAVVVLWWWRSERMAAVDRIPRWTFLASTILLFAVFLVHGPIVGYLCFGAAHALEYLAFVHHFAERRFAGRDRRSLAAVLLGRPLVFAPIVIAAFGALYLLVQPSRGSEVFLAYYVGTSMLHFLFDGWIWKLRKPAVAAPLGI